jgi:transcriptional regulator with XRE-family HTH domain
MTRRRKPGPGIAGQRLREQIRAYRNHAGLTQADAAQELDWSESKIHRIESGLQRTQTSDLMAMLRVYDVPAEEQDALIQLARFSREPSFSSIYKSDITDTFALYLDYEVYADYIYSYQSKWVAEPVQVSGYADALLQVFPKKPDLESKDRLVDLRNERARLLVAHDGPEMRFIFDEAALHRAVGGEELGWGIDKYDAMRRLFDNLRRHNTVAQKGPKDPSINPNVSIQIVPFEFGVYRALGGPFVVLDYDESKDKQIYEDRPVVYFEDPTGEQLSDDKAQVAQYRSMFLELSEAIPGPEVTDEILHYVELHFKDRIDNFPEAGRPRRRPLVD